MKEQTQYEIDKNKSKEKLVRNEFLYNDDSQSKYEFPIIRKQNININKIKFLSYTDSKKEDKENKDKTIHFFTYDWKFEKVYDEAEEELEKLKQYYALLSPDFSMFTNMPIALQIESVFKNRWCGAYWQSKGLKVIPTVSWGDERSFEFCFEGIEEGSVVAVCTYYRENDEESFMIGYNEMLKRIKPSAILCYDEPFKSMSGNITSFTPTTQEWTKDLGWKEQIKFKWEKQNKNISGFNSKDFKYFKYDDPNEKTNIKKCDVCDNPCLIDEFGNGKCNNCSWEQGGSSLELKYKVGYPNLIPLSKAKKLYKFNKLFNPDFEDFINNLLFYGEMEFEYKNFKYVVDRYTDKFEIQICKVNDYENRQSYKSIDEFISKAKIDNKLLKDIWEDITNVNWQS